MARELVARGDGVLLTARRKADAARAAREIEEEAKLLTDVYRPGGRAVGVACDVGVAEDVAALAEAARTELGGCDAWISNAGLSGDYGWFLDQSGDASVDVVRTNLGGSLLCSQHALRLFAEQDEPGAIFFVDGAGADGLPTPRYATYGATKAAVAQLWRSVASEAESVGATAHVLSPGMVLTPLLLQNTDGEGLAATFNVLCEHPEVPAAYLVPRARELVGAKAPAYVRYLNVPRAIGRVLTWPWRRNRHFDEATGLKLYADSFVARAAASAPNAAGGAQAPGFERRRDA